MSRPPEDPWEAMPPKMREELLIRLEAMEDAWRVGLKHRFLPPICSAVVFGLGRLRRRIERLHGNDEETG